MGLSLPLVLKIWTMIVALFGIGISITMWVYPFFTAAGFLEGVVLIVIQVMMFLVEVVDVSFWDYFRFMKTSWGRSALHFIIGALVAGTYGIWIGAWVVYWATGVMWAIFAVIPGITPAPALAQRGNGDSAAAATDNYTHLT